MYKKISNNVKLIYYKIKHVDISFYAHNNPEVVEAVLLILKKGKYTIWNQSQNAYQKYWNTTVGVSYPSDLKKNQRLGMYTRQKSLKIPKVIHLYQLYNGVNEYRSPSVCGGGSIVKKSSNKWIMLFTL